MAATVHFNLLSATINGVVIVEPLTLDVTYESSVATSTSSAAAYSEHLNVGPKSRTATITAQDPKSLLAAVVATAAGFVFAYQHVGDVPDTSVTLTLTSATHIAVGTSFEWDSGNPGEFGQATATFIISGTTYAIT